MAGHHFYSRERSIPAGFYMERVLGYLPTGGGIGTMPLYRFYNGDVGDHYYNTSPTVPPGYVSEGTEGFVLVVGAPLTPKDATPLFRFFHPGSGDHYMSTSATVPAGYVADGGVGAIYPAPVGGRVPLLQFYNVDAGKHFYSLDATLPPGYVFEGIAAYVLPSAAGLGSMQLHRFYNPDGVDHYYSTDATVPSGYVDEGTEGYVVRLADPALVPEGMTMLYRFFAAGHGDHYMSTSPTPPAGYAADGTVGYVFASAGSDREPLYQFYEFEDDSDGFLSGIVEGVRDVADWAIHAVDTVVGVVDQVSGWVLGPIGYLVEVVLDIPVVGRFVRWLRSVVFEATNRVVGLVDFVLTWLGFELRKKMRVCIIIQTDQGQPVVARAVVQRALDYAYGVFDRCRITLVPVGDDFIRFDAAPEGGRTLDVATDGESASRDLGRTGADINLLMRRNGFTGLGHAMVGYGVPIWVIAVRSFNTSGTVGTSLGPLTDYVLVQFSGDPTASTMAHEIGHSCGLLHADSDLAKYFAMSSDDPNNLMKPAFPRGTGELTKAQRAYVRSSRHVSFF